MRAISKIRGLFVAFSVLFLAQTAIWADTCQELATKFADFTVTEDCTGSNTLTLTGSYDSPDDSLVFDIDEGVTLSWGAKTNSKVNVSGSGNFSFDGYYGFIKDTLTIGEDVTFTNGTQIYINETTNRSGGYIFSLKNHGTIVINSLTPNVCDIGMGHYNISAYKGSLVNYGTIQNNGKFCIERFGYLTNYGTIQNNNAIEFGQYSDQNSYDGYGEFIQEGGSSVTSDVPILITNPNITTEVGKPFNLQLKAVGKEVTEWYLGTNLPQGLALSAAGLISGTPEYTYDNLSSRIMLSYDATSIRVNFNFTITKGAQTPLVINGLANSYTYSEEPIEFEVTGGDGDGELSFEIIESLSPAVHAGEAPVNETESGGGSTGGGTGGGSDGPPTQVIAQVVPVGGKYMLYINRTGTFTLKVTKAGGAAYEDATVAKTITVEKATLTNGTISITPASDIAYGDYLASKLPLNGIPANYDGAPVFEYSTDNATYSEDVPNAPGDYFVRAKFAATNNYNEYTTAEVAFTIGKKIIEITDYYLSIEDRYYNGSDVAEFYCPDVEGEVDYQKVGDDDLTIVCGEAKFEDKNAGENKSIIFEGFELAGDDKENYTLELPENITATIWRMTLYWDWHAEGKGEVETRPYDGTTVATVSKQPLLLDEYNVIPPDVTAECTGTAEFASPDAGTDIPVYATDYCNIVGADAINYLAPQEVPSFANGAITPIQLTWNQNGVVAEKVYDGTTAATISAQPTLTGVIPSEDVTATSEVEFIDANAGTNTVNIISYDITGADKGNYLKPIAEPAFTVGAITKAEQEPLIITGLEEEYAVGSAGVIASTTGGSGDGAVTYSVTGNCNIDASTGEISNITFGGCQVTATKAGDNNYEDETSDPVSFDIKGAQTELEFAEYETEFTYGDEGFTLTLTESGLGDGALTFASSAPDVATVNATGEVTIVGAGTFTITATKAGDVDYISASKTTSSITVNKAEQAELTIAENYEDEYEFGDAGFTLEVGGGTGGGAITYESSAPDVATVNASGEVTFVGTGTFTITATRDGGNNYEDESKTTSEITVGKGTPTVSALAPLEATVGETLADVVLPTVPNGTLAWKEATTTSVGEVGERVHKAIFTHENSNYNTIEIDITINVVKGNTPILPMQFANIHKNAKVEVFNMNGKRMTGTAGLAKGVYIVKVTQGSDTKVMRMAVK